MARKRSSSPVGLCEPISNIPLNVSPEIRTKQERKPKGPGGGNDCNNAQTRFWRSRRRRARDLEHKSSREAVVDSARERGVSTLVIGDVRNVADGKHLTARSQQKIGLWSHGRQRQYITYKAEAAGISITLCDEAYHEPKGV